MSDPKRHGPGNVERALRSVEQLEHEPSAGDDDGLDPDKVEVLRGDDAPLSGDPSGEGRPPDVSLAGDLADELAAIPSAEAEAPAVGDAPKKKDPKDAIIEAMIAAKHEAAQVLEQTQKEAKSLHERLLRSQADFDNYKKRERRERDEALKFANEKLLKELLPVIDNLERALAAAEKAKGESQDPLVQSVVDGLTMVHKGFVDAVAKFGVVGFSALGQPFDPGQQEAVQQREDTGVPNGTVIEEYQRGYTLHGRLVRPSMVVVSSGGPPRAAAGEAGGEG